MGVITKNLKKESTNVDKKPGSNCQENKTKNLNLIKGEAGSLSNPVSVQIRGQADSMWKLIINDIIKSITFNKRDCEVLSDRVDEKILLKRKEEKVKELNWQMVQNSTVWSKIVQNI